MSASRDTLRPAPWILFAVALCACHGSTPANVSSAVSGKRYTVRAEVVTLPAQAGGELLLRHEAIPDFTDKSGTVVGMDSMVMPFPVSASLTLTGLAPGDRIEFVLSVDWAQNKYVIESLKKLPPETTLKLEKRNAMGSTASDISDDAKK